MIRIATRAQRFRVPGAELAIPAGGGVVLHAGCFQLAGQAGGRFEAPAGSPACLAHPERCPEATTVIRAPGTAASPCRSKAAGLEDPASHGQRAPAAARLDHMQARLAWNIRQLTGNGRARPWTQGRADLRRL